MGTGIKRRSISFILATLVAWHKTLLVFKGYWFIITLSMPLYYHMIIWRLVFCVIFLAFVWRILAKHVLRVSVYWWFNLRSPKKVFLWSRYMFILRRLVPSSSNFVERFSCTEDWRRARFGARIRWLRQAITLCGRNILYFFWQVWQIAASSLQYIANFLLFLR